jgi:hypothetical protein
MKVHMLSIAANERAFMDATTWMEKLPISLKGFLYNCLT